MASRKEISKCLALLKTEFPDFQVDENRRDVWGEGLAGFDDAVLNKAVADFLRTSRFKPHLADLIDRCKAQLDGDWLGADEAWSRIAKSESESCMLTNESAEAWNIARPLLESRDTNGARMAFRDAYNRLTDKAKLEGRRPVYFPSWGADTDGRIQMLSSAVKCGQIGIDRAIEVLPEHAVEVIRMVGVKNHPLLAPPSEEGKQRVKALLLTLKG